jgi:chloride channel protein, CIC family
VTTTTPDPVALLRSRNYLRLLLLAAIIGAPISVAAYFFLTLVTKLQQWIYTDLPKGLGFDGTPLWWPIPFLALAGLLVGLTLRYLPGTGGHSPAEGFKAGGPPPGPADLPGVALAALATLSLGAVLGPEAPLIALGGGLGVCAVRLARKDAPPQVTTMVAAAGSFTAISTLFGSPLLGAFLLMEAAGLAGATLELVLVPGLLASGIGSLIFIGLDNWTGLGTFSLAIPGLPPTGPPTGADFGWALVIGVAAALVGSAIRRLALLLRPHVEYKVLATVVAGLAVAGFAVVYAAATGKDVTDVLFSGQDALGPLIVHSASYTAGAVVLLVICKSLAYSVSMSGFRGGPVFPAMFVGAAGGIALSHLPGLEVIPAAAMGIGAMCAVLLRLPMTSVLLATVLLTSDGLAVMPVVIVAVVVAYVASAWLLPASQPAQAQPAAPPPAGQAGAGSAGSVPAVPVSARQDRADKPQDGEDKADQA